MAGNWTPAMRATDSEIHLFWSYSTENNMEKTMSSKHLPRPSLRVSIALVYYSQYSNGFLFANYYSSLLYSIILLLMLWFRDLSGNIIPLVYWDNFEFITLFVIWLILGLSIIYMMVTWKIIDKPTNPMVPIIYPLGTIREGSVIFHTGKLFIKRHHDYTQQICIKQSHYVRAANKQVVCENQNILMAYWSTCNYWTCVWSTVVDTPLNQTAFSSVW